MIDGTMIARLMVAGDSRNGVKSMAWIDNNSQYW